MGIAVCLIDSSPVMPFFELARLACLLIVRDGVKSSWTYTYSQAEVRQSVIQLHILGFALLDKKKIKSPINCLHPRLLQFGRT